MVLQPTGDADSDVSRTDSAVDFFVSYTGCDEVWAEWIAWQLEAAGYRVLLQAWDFGVGAHFVTDMHRAARDVVRTIAVLSAAYLDSAYAEAEWQAAWKDDPAGRDRKLLAFRIEDCLRPGLLGQLVTVDLFGLDHDMARDRLLNAARNERRKPAVEPVFPGIRGHLSAAIGTEPLFPGRFPDVWNVPGRLANFTGRDTLLGDIHQLLDRGATVIALHGLGGIGKTQLAAEYAWRYASDYDLVWWIDSASQMLLASGLADLAPKLDLLVRPEVADTVDAVLAALRQRRRWLLVFDNAEDPRLLHAFLPGTGGNILITSRNPSWAQIAAPIELAVFAREETLAILRRCDPTVEEGVANALAHELGDLPLAAAQAAAYLGETGMSHDRYLRLFRSRRELLSRGTVVGYHGRLDTVWTLSADHLAELAGAELQLLQLCAFLAPEPIPLRILIQRAEVLDEPLRSIVSDEIDFEDALRWITRYSLARRHGEALTLHRLVQAVVRGNMDPDRLRGTCLQAQNMFSAPPINPVDSATWPEYARLAPHILALWDHTGHTGTELFRQAILRLARYLERVGHHSTCRQLTEQARKQWQHWLGPNHPDTLAAAHRHAAVLRVLGEFEQARRLAEDTLAGRRRLLGSEHLDTLSSASNLGAILQELGDYDDARRVAEQTLDGRRKVLGNNQPGVLISVHNLALAHCGLGNFEYARQLQEENLARRTRVLGDDHLDTLDSATKLALTLTELGRHEEARQLNENALAHRRRLLGDEHPDTLASEANLARNLHALTESPPTSS